MLVTMHLATTIWAIQLDDGIALMHISQVAVLLFSCTLEAEALSASTA
jgi:hypothetical protein